MAVILAIFRRLVMALLAGSYWIATGWLCFVLTGSDPIDTLTSDRPFATVLCVWGIVAAACFLYAMASLKMVAMPMRRLPKWLAKAVFSASFWFGALYVAMGLFLAERITDAGVVGPVELMPLWLYVLMVLAGYTSCSAAWDRMVGYDKRQPRAALNRT